MVARIKFQDGVAELTLEKKRREAGREAARGRPKTPCRERRGGRYEPRGEGPGPRVTK